jgi:streptogramin lyase
VKRKITTVLLIGVLAIIGASGVAAAPPEHNKQYRTIALECGSASYTVVSNSQSQGVAFLDEEGGYVFILVSFEVIDPVTGEIATIPVGQGNRTGQHGKLITCETPDLNTFRATFLRVQTGS